MFAAKSPGTHFPSRNLAFVFFALPFLLTACAPTKGFLNGTLGGVPVIDEHKHGEMEPGSLHSSLKQAGHLGVLIFLSVANWPLAAVYGLTSGAYGAYQFYKMDQTAAERPEDLKKITLEIKKGVYE